MKHRWLLPLLFVVGLILLVAAPSTAHNGEDHDGLHCDDPSVLYCPVSADKTIVAALTNMPVPKVAGPPSPISTPPLTIKKPVTKTVTYDVATKGTLTADFAQFKQQAAETYVDDRGWTRLGVQFKEVESSGQFTLVLSEASQVPSYGSPCDSQYSCRVGRYVVINQNRWLGASDSWNNAGGDLRNYRHMVINHETGHWLGHGHTYCGGAGQSATVMMQQSIDLGGCKFNPWPQDSEIWSTTLGI